MLRYTSFRSILKTVEWFLGEVKIKEDKGNIVFLDKIIEIYNLKPKKYESRNGRYL